MDKRWTILLSEPAKLENLQQSLGVHRAICQILVQRGVETFEEARRYFRPDLANLHDPWIMKDMEKAVQRLLLAFRQHEKIMVFGDYDVDGTTSVACLTQFLRKYYQTTLVDFYIPNRHREGYGISQAGIEYAQAQGFSLIVSVDCGIKSVELIADAKQSGIDFIICDHHLPDETLPPATAILNPRQQGCQYPYKDLCGCGIVFKLLLGLSDRMGISRVEVYAWLDLVATAIAADIVPVTGENRILAFFGLKKVNEHPNYGIQALIQVSGMQKQLEMDALIFLIAPRINAAGRMDDARKVVQLFMSIHLEEALRYAHMLHSDNIDRKEVDLAITDEALAMIDKDPQAVNRKSTVVFQSHWHKGVVGIVASRLIGKYYRPTIVLTRSGEIIAGSARSVTGFNVYEAVHACRAHLLGYGGHFAAAGMTLLPEHLEVFSAKFEQIVSDTIEPHLLIPEIVVDATVALKELTNGLFNIVAQMQPFGPGNRQPLFLARKLMNTGYSKLVKEQHIRFSLCEGKTVFTGIGFNLAGKFGLLQTGKPIDVLFLLERNDWNDQTNLQLKVIDIREAQP